MTCDTLTPTSWLLTAGAVWLALAGLYTTIVLIAELSNAIRDEGATPPNPIVSFFAVVLLAPIALVISLSGALWAGWLRIHGFLLGRSAIYQYAYSFFLARRLSDLQPAGCQAILEAFTFKSKCLRSVLEKCARNEEGTDDV